MRVENNTNQALLEVRDLRTYFKIRDGAVHAVDGVSFELEPGERLGIVGESGCGKSVTALSIMRLVPTPPAELTGEILFDGKDLLEMNDSEIQHIRGKQIAMIFQDPMTSLNPVLTIGRQLTEGLELHMKMNRRQAQERAVEMLTLVGIPEAKSRLKSYPHQFSGGMRQRVMIALALACQPRALIADEPTTALDVTVQAQILEIMNDVCKESGTALMLITHDLGVVAGVTDRILVMYAGQVVEAAPTGELFENPLHPYTLGLLRSVPRLDEERQEELVPIEGSPPDLLAPPPGCRFAPRCAYVTERCKQIEPPLRTVGNAALRHFVRCHYDLADPEVRRRGESRVEAQEGAKLATIEQTARELQEEKPV